jgi:tetratricopeptide (TPR) repeat protein/predicted Ser/Thr protein kinase
LAAPTFSIVRLLTQIRQDQRLRWRGGERPRVEDYLERYPALRADAAAVVELAYAEFELREELGEAPAVEEYLERFPHHTEALQRQLDFLCELLKGMAIPGPEATLVADAPTPKDTARPPTQAAETGGSTEAWVPIDPAPSAAPPIVAVPGYEVISLLGKGGMGVVYMARQRRLNRVVALKMILHAEHAGTDERRRFQAEAEAVARLQHPHIVQIHEVGEHNGLPFFSLEFCPGGSLGDKLDGTPWEAKKAAALVEVLARTMQAAHALGIVHRDLKPDNILLTATGDPKVTDFGLAKKLDETGHTRTGAVMGTPSYMAPEQAGGKKVISPATDVYALGAILYELLTGRPPFRAATPLDTMWQVVHDDPVPVRRLQPKVPKDLETICLKCLEKEPTKRYPTAESLAEDLQRFRAGQAIAARPVGVLRPATQWARRRPVAAATLVGGPLLGLALLIGAMLYSARAAQKQAVARAETRDLLTLGQEAAASQDWKRAETLLDQALQKVEAEPALAEMRQEAEAVRSPVRARLKALDTYQRFSQDRDAALLHATLAGGEDARANLQEARTQARAALEAVGFSPGGEEGLTLDPAFTAGEKADVTAGSYMLLLTLAEVEAKGPSHKPAEDVRPGLQRALALLDRADRLGVKSRAIHLRRARYLTLLGDQAAAEKENTKGHAPANDLDFHPQDHFLVGQELYTRGELEKSTEEFRRALRRQPGDFWANYFLGICSVKMGNPAVAVAHFTVCQSQRKDLVWVYLLRGFASGQMQEYAAAEKDFDTALALKPTAAARYVLFNNRGVMRVAQKERWAQGVEDLLQAAALRPDHFQAHASLSEAYRLNGRPDEAAKHLDEAIQLAGRGVAAGEVESATLALLYRNRGRLHLQGRQIDAAVRDLTEAARLAGNDGSLKAQIDADRGRVLQTQKRFGEALAAYDRALEANLGRVEVHRWRGEVLLAQGRYEESIAAFDAYLTKGGQPSVALYHERGLAREKLGRLTEAVEDYSLALGAGPKDEERGALYLSRGQDYLALDALQPALRDFEEALRLQPDNANAALGRALVRVKLGDIVKGVADAERAVKDDPNEPSLWHGAARVYAQAAALVKAPPGRETEQAILRAQYQQKAIVLLRKALDLTPAGQRQGYWRKNVMKDAALDPIRNHPEFVRLTAQLGGQNP